ncbi:MAG: Gldg family protein [Rhodospirillales bacterium]|nr:Gldg family protein [Rhodospirillales bacterium]
MYTNSKPTRFAVIGLGLAVVLLLAINIFSNATFKALQLDLTEGQLFTLSDGTRKVLATIDEPINVRLFFSKSLGDASPQHATYFKRVKELLGQYEKISGGKVVLKIFNPEPFSDAEDMAVAAGIKGVPINQAGDLGYFGLSAYNSTDDEGLMGFLSPDRETFLEYDITKLIHAIAKPKKLVIGVLSSFPVTGGYGPQGAPNPQWAFLDQLGEFFEILPLPREMPKLPEAVDILLLIHPKNILPEMQYSIDQFVLGGGRALVFVDTNAELAARPGNPALDDTVSDFDPILNAWGVKLVKDKVAADILTARRVNVQQGGKVEYTSYVAWLALTPENMARNDVITGDLQLLNIGSAGILEPIEGAGTLVTPLLETSDQSMEIDRSKVMLQPDVIGLFRDFKPQNKKLMLAARISGKAKSAFPDGPPKGVETDAKAAKPLTESAAGINVIVVADTDFLRDRLWVDRQDVFGNMTLVPHANNGDFVVNAVDNLGGSSELIDLRGRTRTQRPFHLVQDIQRDAEMQYRSKEKELQEKLIDIRAKLNKVLRREDSSGEVIMNTQEKASVDKFRGEMTTIRKELRDVQLALRQDIDTLDSWIKFINIAAIPLILLVISMIAGRRRHTRRRAAVAGQ